MKSRKHLKHLKILLKFKSDWKKKGKLNRKKKMVRKKAEQKSVENDAEYFVVT
jgi:hypothetical protein